MNMESRRHKRSKYGRAVRTFESQNLLMGMHNRRVCGDWPSQDIIRVCQIDNNDLVLLVEFLPHADEMVRFEGQSLSSVVSTTTENQFERCADVRT